MLNKTIKNITNQNKEEKFTYRIRPLNYERREYYISKLSPEKKTALEELDNKSWDEIKPIRYKRHRKYFPSIGDIFLYKSHNGTEFQGLVINNYLADPSSKRSLDWICIIIFKPGIDAKEKALKGITPKDLISPQKLIGNYFWNVGDFRTVDHTDTINMCSYGYYCAGEIIDDFKRPLSYLPDMWTQTGYYTEIGIIYDVEFYLVTGIDYTGDFKI